MLGKCRIDQWWRLLCVIDQWWWLLCVIVVWLLCDCCRRCQLVPEEHEQHDQLPDQQSRMKKFEEIQQTIEEDRPPDKPLSPSLRRINGELEEEQVTPESKCRQSSCKYLEWECSDWRRMIVVDTWPVLSRSIAPHYLSILDMSQSHNIYLFIYLLTVLFLVVDVATCVFSRSVHHAWLILWMSVFRPSIWSQHL